jgi:hypothetical protein
MLPVMGVASNETLSPTPPRTGEGEAFAARRTERLETRCPAPPRRETLSVS